MKLRKDFIVHNTDKETMLVATGKAKFSGLVKGNLMLGEILSLLGKETTEEEAVRTMPPPGRLRPTFTRSSPSCGRSVRSRVSNDGCI